MNWSHGPRDWSEGAGATARSLRVLACVFVTARSATNVNVNVNVNVDTGLCTRRRRPVATLSSTGLSVRDAGGHERVFAGLRLR